MAASRGAARRGFARATGGAILSVWCALRASAGEADALQVIQVTATRAPASTQEVSQGVTVIERETLRRRVPLTVTDHLRGEPGVYLQQTTPGQGVPIVRGLKGSEVLHVVDGFRLNNSIFRNAPNQYLALVDAWNLERIELVRGPLSTLHGGDAMGGVVQFFSRSPSFEGSEVRARGKAGLQWVSADERTASQLEGEFGNEDWVAHMGATWQDAGNLRVGGGDTLPHTNFRSEGAYTKLTLDGEGDSQFIVQAQFTRQPETSRYDALVPGFGQTRPDSSELAFEPQERWFGQVRWRTQDATWLADSSDVQLGVQRIVDDRVSRDYQSPNRETERNSTLLAGAVGHFTKRLAERHELSFGFEVYRDRVESARSRTNIETGARTERPSRFPDGSTMAWAGVYAADRWTPHPRVDLLAGVRLTRYDIELTPTINDIGVTLSPRDVSGSLGAVFRLTDELNLVANAGRGFRPPNIFDLGTFGARGNRFGIPNSDLDPESVYTVDLGLKFANESMRAELMAFESDYRDKITQVLTGETDSSGRLIVQSRNATRLLLRGIEAGGMWQVADAARLSATATWTWGEERLDSLAYPADRIPPWFGRLAAEFLPAPEWTLEAAVNWAAGQGRLSPRDAIDPRINPRGTAGWTTFGVRAHWRATPMLSIATGFENLGDLRYREHGSGFDSAGRSAFASVELSF
jgi:outer membrane receptor protein involved in Fe transport